MAILRLDAARREIGAEVILDSITPRSRAATGSAWSARTVPARRRCCGSCAGIDEPDTGERRTAPRGLRVGLLAQEANLDADFTSAASVRDAVRSGAGELVAMERRLAELEALGPAAVETAEYARLRDDFEARGGYTLDVRVDSALSGLGFARERLGPAADRDVGRPADAGGPGTRCWSRSSTC